MRATKLMLAMGVLALLVGCKEEPPEAAKEVPRNVRVLELRAESLDEYFEIAGPVAPVKGTDLGAEESGPVTAIPRIKGARVEAGDAIVVLDRTILRAERESAAATEKAQAFNLDKMRQLRQAGKISELELLNTESDYEQAAAAAAVAARRLERAAVRAPFAGVVADRYVELGQLVSPGQPVARVIDPYTLKLEAYLTDVQVDWVRRGSVAQVLLGESETAASGTVSWIGNEADRRTGKFKVEIEIPNPELRLHSGVIGRARLPKNRIADVLVIPRDAVVASPTGPSAFVVAGEQNPRALRRIIELGPDQGLMVVVRDGLKSGDRLVVRGQRDLNDGNLVTVTETTTAPDGSLPGDPEVVRAARAGTRTTDDTEEAVR